jgi:hypothetical protein
MKHNWSQDEFHPTQQCFFCKKHAAVSHDDEELYKVIRNTTGFPGYVVNYTTAHIPIPICSQCSAVHRKENKHLGIIRFIAWVITTGIICYWIYDSADGLFVSLILSMLVAIPLSFVLAFVMVIIWSVCNSNTIEVASKEDYPVVKKLLNMGWQWKMPKAKYGERKNESIDKDTINQLNVANQQEAKDVILDFLTWCKTKESQ